MYINQSRLFACAASALNVVNIGGVFVVLLCGLSVAILVAIMEFCWRARKINNESHPMLGQVSADHCMVRQPVHVLTKVHIFSSVTKIREFSFLWFS